MKYYTKKSVTLSDWMDATVAYGKVAIEKFASIEMDFPTTILFGRDGRPVMSAGLTSKTIPYGEMFWSTVMVGCSGLDGDVVIALFDTWAYLTEINPDTGQLWTPPDIDKLVSDDPTALDRGIVTECLTLLIANRAGDVMSDIHHYRRHDGNKIEWTGSGNNRSTTDDNGLVSTMRNAMLTDTYGQHHSKHHAGKVRIPQEKLDLMIIAYLKMELDVVAMLILPDFTE